MNTIAEMTIEEFAHLYPKLYMSIIMQAQLLQTGGYYFDTKSTPEDVFKAESTWEEEQLALKQAWEDDKRYAEMEEAEANRCPHCGSYEGNFQDCPECGHNRDTH